MSAETITEPPVAGGQPADGPTTHWFFGNEQFNFERQVALGGIAYGGGDVGEMVATADRIVDGDADSWCTEWTATAERIAVMADNCQARGHRISPPLPVLRRRRSAQRQPR